MEEEEGLKPKYALAVSISKNGDGGLTVKLPNGAIVDWPKELAPADIDSEAYLELVTPGVLEHRKKDLAREVLLKILNIGREE